MIRILITSSFYVYPIKYSAIFFQAAVVSILLYGCTTWMLTKHIKKNFDSSCMLQAILNKSWMQYPTEQQEFGHLPPISKNIQIKWTRYAEYFWKNKDDLISDVLLWTPSHKHASVGRPARTYIQQLCTDTGCSSEDLPEAMDDRDGERRKERERES